MGTPRYPKDMASEWQKLKRDIKGNFSSANIRQGLRTISSGVVTIFNGLILEAGASFVARYANGVNSLGIGNFTLSNGDQVRGILIRRPNGSAVMWAYGDDETGDGFWGLYDKQGNIVVSDDAASGIGLATPWIPYTWTRTANLMNPTDTNGTTTYQSVHTIVGYMQHPRLRLDGYVHFSTSGTANVRVIDPATNQVIVTSNNVGEGFLMQLTGNHPDYEFAKWFRYDIQIRLATGTGTVGFTPIAIHGVQSP